MKELSLHILDIVQNSISAQSSFIQIKINEDFLNDLFEIEIIDNGVGMDEELLNKVLDPFTTTRKTRKVGLGLSLFQAIALQCEGAFEINSKLGQGTYVKAVFKHSHIDRPPLGNMADSLVICLMSNSQADFSYEYTIDKEKFIFDTRTIKETIKDIPITDMTVINWIREYIKEGHSALVKS